jgi:Sigma-70, region 4
LPLRYREPVVLFYFHEMDVATAARTLGMPEGTLKARLSRARTLLRQRFPRLEEEYASHHSQKLQEAGPSTPLPLRKAQGQGRSG